MGGVAMAAMAADVNWVAGPWMTALMAALALALGCLLAGLFDHSDVEFAAVDDNVNVAPLPKAVDLENGSAVSGVNCARRHAGGVVDAPLLMAADLEDGEAVFGASCAARHADGVDDAPLLMAADLEDGKAVFRCILCCLSCWWRE